MIGFLWTAAILFWCIFSLFFGIDRSRYRNCIVLFLAIVTTFYAVMFSLGDRAVTLSFLIIFFLLILVPVILIWNGIVIIRKEGFRLANVLSLVLGVLIGLGEIATISAFFESVSSSPSVGVQTANSIRFTLQLLFSVSVVYLSFSILMFVVYSVFLMLIPRKRDFDYVVIHGAGLLHGNQVTRLLGDRIDKAIELYRKDPTPPYMIPSGGKGSDEAVSEAQAMKGYLLEKDIPEDKILLEDQSKNTFENLKNSKTIIDAREGRKYTAIVTSNYHVYRALRYCRKIGFDCTGVGSRVALYYWSSALIREYVAVHAEKKHLITLIAGWLLCILPIIIAAAAG